MTDTQIVFGCNHIPFQNMIMWKNLLKLIRDIRPNGINLIGDVIDMNSLSFHEKGKFALIDIKDEYKLIKKHFDDLEEAIGKRKVQKRYVWGNHENRYLRHIQLPDNKRIIHEAPEEYLRLRENNWEVKTNWSEDFFVLGNHLELFHGSLLGVNPAKAQLDKLKRSCMFVHSHRFGAHYDGNMASFNIGWGGDINAPAFSYASRLTKRNWINGFAIVNIDDNGYYHVQPINLYNNTFYYNGKKY